MRYFFGRSGCLILSVLQTKGTIVEQFIRHKSVKRIVKPPAAFRYLISEPRSAKYKTSFGKRPQFQPLQFPKDPVPLQAFFCCSAKENQVQISAKPHPFINCVFGQVRDQIEEMKAFPQFLSDIIPGPVKIGRIVHFICQMLIEHVVVQFKNNIFCIIGPHRVIVDQALKAEFLHDRIGGIPVRRMDQEIDIPPSYEAPALASNPSESSL